MAHVSPRTLNATLSSFKRVYLYDACILCFKIMKEEREVETTQRHADMHNWCATSCIQYYTVGHISGVFTDLWAQMQGAGTKEQAISYAHLDLRQGWDKARAYSQPTFSFTSLIEIGCFISCV